MNFISNAWAQEGPGGVSSVFSMFMPLIVVFVIFYFLIFRPQQKTQKKRRAMLANLKRGDEILTSAGFYGKIMELGDKFIMVQLAGNVIVKLERSHVGTLEPTAADQPKKS